MQISNFWKLFTERSFRRKTLLKLKICNCTPKAFLSFKPIQDDPIPPLTIFSPLTSTNVGISSKTFWFLVLTLLLRRCNISSPYHMAVLNYWTWIKITSQKKFVFPVKSSSNWNYDNLSHINARVTKFWSHDRIYNIIWDTW